MNIGVFCSANNQIDAAYFRAADALGRWMAENGHTLVYGGCDLGLMEAVGRAVHDNGGTTIGVVPRVIEKAGRLSDAVSVEIACEDLTDRKQIMMERSDVFVALPGGIGTLDEIFTVAAAYTIGYHRKKLYLLNIGGFYDALIAVLDDLARRGMTRGDWHDCVEPVTSLSQLQEKLA
ncbi:TIGR00730 family Rossman fold protein [Prevotella sp. A2931]|uniref:Cytokinin riboside 5'-monophosphate phosphoribohydrolase n=1 Tax=Prevotella illustrans TaxID=2800387 RepID=A0ABS3M2D4_9BACT|nr:MULTISPECIES: TIGR00730 family Rossman fold protein [Prevotella]MBO1362349.1 TIGR00730 family Rossman fold protein [Prevotella illustrans]PTL26408.1 TIGR00730 family Rossman fold protein [Prevotella sp. oral taxon 820]